MAQSEKIYSTIPEAETVIKELCEKYPDELWQVRPDMVSVLAVENKKRPEKSDTLARVVPIKGVEKALMQINNVNTRYVIELYWSDWNEWGQNLRQWIMFHELLHICKDIGKTVKHDCEDFRMIIDKAGVDWVNRKDLPNMLLEKVDFNLDLRPGVSDDGRIKDEDSDVVPPSSQKESEDGQEPDELVFDPDE